MAIETFLAYAKAHNASHHPSAPQTGLAPIDGIELENATITVLEAMVQASDGAVEPFDCMSWPDFFQWFCRVGVNRGVLVDPAQEFFLQLLYRKWAMANTRPWRAHICAWKMAR